MVATTASWFYMRRGGCATGTYVVARRGHKDGGARVFGRRRTVWGRGEVLSSGQVRCTTATHEPARRKTSPCQYASVGN